MIGSWLLFFIVAFVPIHALAVLPGEGDPIEGARSANMGSTIPGDDPCANSTDQPGCYKGAAAAIIQKNNQATTDSGAPRPPKLAKKPVDRGHNEFQEFVAKSLGKTLPMYGYGLFNEAPDTFAPVDNIPVTPDYLIGPGDEIIIRGWGKADIDLRAVVDRNGVIVLPRAGAVNVAGIRYQDLQPHLEKAIGRVLRNFSLNVTLGKLRSIQIFVVGQAMQPGVYTVSSLSTLINALFASGGPSLRGSLRHIQLKRSDKTVTELDMYDLLLKGDKTKDVALLPGDVIFIPTIGAQVAVSGSVNNPAIYELKDDKTTLADLFEMAGGLTNIAAAGNVKVERIEDHKMRKVEEFPLTRSGLDRLLKDGDSVQVASIQGRFDNAVTLRGNIASPGRYPWKKGMHVSDLIPDKSFLIARDYWAKQNQVSPKRGNEESFHGELISNTSSEINWDYAVIERLNKDDLTTALIPFNLGQAITALDTRDNQTLEEGDIVTVFSKGDIKVPVAKQSVYVRLEGEVSAPGIYSVLPGETLRQLVIRTGGLSKNAYLFSAELDRESVRIAQQKRLQEMSERMDEDIKRNLAAKQHGALTQEDASMAQLQADAQTGVVGKMREVKATGRVVLDIPPNNAGVKNLPDLALEDGDRFVVHVKPSTVSVMGMVYNANEFIFQPGLRVSDCLAKAGGATRDADTSRLYLVRADGSVLSSQSSNSMFGGFSNQELMPGDTLVVPEVLDTFYFSKELKDWSQIFYQFALGVGGLKLLGL